MKMDPMKPRYVRFWNFDYRCVCGHAGIVDEQTPHTVFDPDTGRFTCPVCWETHLLMVTMTPVEPSGETPSSATGDRDGSDRT